MNRTFSIPIGLGILAAAGSALVAHRLRLRKTGGFDERYTAAYPPSSGAVSAVTGGPPEDMNQMPAQPGISGTIYDGSQLACAGARPESK